MGGGLTRKQYTSKATTYRRRLPEGQTSKHVTSRRAEVRNHMGNVDVERENTGKRGSHVESQSNQ